MGEETAHFLMSSVLHFQAINSPRNQNMKNRHKRKNC